MQTGQQGRAQQSVQDTTHVPQGGPRGPPPAQWAAVTLTSGRALPVPGAPCARKPPPALSDLRSPSHSSKFPTGQASGSKLFTRQFRLKNFAKEIQCVAIIIIIVITIITIIFLLLFYYSGRLGKLKKTPQTNLGTTWSLKVTSSQTHSQGIQSPLPISSSTPNFFPAQYRSDSRNSWFVGLLIT